MIREAVTAFSRRQKGEGGSDDAKPERKSNPSIEKTDTKPEAPEAKTDAKSEAKPTAPDAKADAKSDAKPDAPEAKSDAPEAKADVKTDDATVQAIPDAETKPERAPEALAESKPELKPPAVTAESPRIRQATLVPFHEQPVGKPPEMPAFRTEHSAIGEVEEPTRMPSSREIPAGDPEDPAAPPGAVPPGDSRSFRRAHEFALVYRQATFVISRFGKVGQRGQWRVVEYPTSASASHSYAKECSRFVSEGFSDYRG
jgi:ribonuclease E